MNSQKGFVVPLVIALVAILAIGGGVYYYAHYNPPFEVFTPDPNISTTTAPIIGGDKDEHGCLGPAGYSWCAVKNKCLRVWEEKCEVGSISTADWKTYTNNDLGFELKTPAYVSVDLVSNNQYNKHVTFRSDKENFEVKLKSGSSTSLDQYHFLDFPISFKSSLDGKEAAVFEAPKGYCDGPGCSSPFVAYSAKNGDNFFNLIFYGDTKLSDVEKSILSSFKFISTNPVACTMDAKQCPDGSWVGRSGSNCEFVCPISSDSDILKKQSVTISNIKITPFEIVEDSRCSVNVVCVWEGTVKLRVELQNNYYGTKEVTLILGKGQEVFNSLVTLTNVKPIRESGEDIVLSDYRFDFTVRPSM